MITGNTMSESLMETVATENSQFRNFIIGLNIPWMKQPIRQAKNIAQSTGCSDLRDFYERVRLGFPPRLHKPA